MDTEERGMAGERTETMEDRPVDIMQYGSSFDYRSSTAEPSSLEFDFSSVLDPFTTEVKERYFSEETYLSWVQSVESNVQLRSLTVVASNIKQFGNAGLCRIMHKTMIDLDLSRNYFGKKEITTLAACVGKMTSLRSLKLAYNRIADEEIQILSNEFAGLQQFQKLDLEGNQIKSSFNILPLVSLKDLNLKLNPMTELAWWELFEQMKILQVNCVRISGIELSERLIHTIEDLLRKADGIIDVFELLDVQLPSTEIGLRNISKCRFLSTLNSQTLFHDPDILCISSILGLDYLDLSYSSITSEGLQLLANSFFDFGHCLKFCNISGNFCDSAAAEALQSNLCNLSEVTRLELANLCTTASDFAKVLTGIKLPKLFDLNISGNLNKKDESGLVQAAIRQVLMLNADIKSLDLFDDWIEHFELFTGLLLKVETLNLERTNFNTNYQANFIFLASCKNLKSLNLCEIKSNMDQFNIEESLNLTNLYLPACSLSSSLLGFLISKTAKMVELDLSGSPLSQSFLNQLFSNLPNTLKTLNLSYTNCGDYCCVKIEENISSFRSVRSLSLRHDKITDAGVERVVGRLGDLKELRFLDLSGNKVEGMCFLSACGAETSFLTVLDLRNNPLSPNCHVAFPGKFKFLMSLLR